jgi:serine protease inhibitor
MNMKKTSLEKQIKQSGQAYFDKRTAHLSFQRELHKPKPWWMTVAMWATPTAAVATTVTVLVAVLIGSIDPNGSVPQTFRSLQALNAVSFPSFEQRNQTEDFAQDRPRYETYRTQVNQYFARTATDLFSTANNLAYSPLSAFMALTLLLEAADGQTQEALASLLAVEDMNLLREETSRVFIDTYLEDKVTVNQQETIRARSLLGNGVFVREDIDVNPGYLNRLATDYFTEVFHTDFQPDGLVDMANWLNQKTFNFLDMKPSDLGLNQDTAMALFNTFYLKANWLDAFEIVTTQGQFTNSNNQSNVRGVTYMQKETRSTLYLDQPGFTLGVDEAYGDHRIVYVLPKGNLTPVDLLSPTYLPSIQAAFTSPATNERISLTVPASSTQGKLDLKANLLSVYPEIASLFDPQLADLSKALPGGYVQSLNQHLRVDLHQDGLAAAAITEANVGVTSMPIPPRVSLTLDRSFLYFVINHQGLMLFSGVVHQPTI